jgi:hypothetical protein
MSLPIGTRSQARARQSEPNNSVENDRAADAATPFNAAELESLLACECVVAGGELCDGDHRYLREFSLLAANSASSAHKSVHVVRRANDADTLFVLKCVVGDDDDKANQEWKANQALISLVNRRVCGGFVAPLAFTREPFDRRFQRWFLFDFVGNSLQFVKGLIPLYCQGATIDDVRAAANTVRLLRVPKFEDAFEDVLYKVKKLLRDERHKFSIKERIEVVDALCAMPGLPLARSVVRVAFDAARALAADDRVVHGAILQVVYSLSCAEQHLKLVHNDLHAKNICLKPFSRWQVLFDSEQVAFFIPPGVRCFVIDFGGSEFDATAHLACERAVDMLLETLAALRKLPLRGISNMLSLWSKLIVLPEFASLGAEWHAQRADGFDVNNAVFFSRDPDALERRVAELTSLCHHTERWTDSVVTAGQIMAGHDFFHFRGGARLSELESVEIAAPAAGVADCWIVRIVDDACCRDRARALGWLVILPGSERVVVVSSEPSNRHLCGCGGRRLSCADAQPRA